MTKLKEFTDAASGASIEYRDLTDLDPGGPPVVEVFATLGGLTYAERHTIGSGDGTTPDATSLQADIDARRASVIATLKARQAVRGSFANLK